MREALYTRARVFRNVLILKDPYLGGMWQEGNWQEKGCGKRDVETKRGRVVREDTNVGVPNETENSRREIVASRHLDRYERDTERERARNGTTEGKVSGRGSRDWQGTVSLVQTSGDRTRGGGPRPPVNPTLSAANVPRPPSLCTGRFSLGSLSQYYVSTSGISISLPKHITFCLQKTHLEDESGKRGREQGLSDNGDRYRSFSRL